MLPQLRELTIQLAKDYQISGIRQAALRRTLIPNHLWLAAATRKDYPQSKPNATDYFFSMHQWIGPDGQPVEAYFNNEFRSLIARPAITVEMVTHPGALHDPDFPPDTLLPTNANGNMIFYSIRVSSSG